MKTIEERASEFIEKAANGQEVPDYINELLKNCYCAAVEEEHEELTKWHDPKEPPKEEYMTILLRFRYNKHIQRYMYCTGFYGSGQFVVGDTKFNADNITGWRYIHEND